ncbi:hypothetical protein [Paenibacillus gallinarum]|uniref:Type I restriction endonuclease subunit M n=1 Tax=Paenibacillus gallinarum TaxID=2762232 RepID=A0ABR8T5P3_9BACL|nr:hypothetical protein [Paenibacillus gallinarum]MBD7971103.1 hypothetical protein [Paenibacillus gallinarum]
MRHIFSGKFLLGQVVATPGVMEATTEEERISALTRHLNGDWGEVSPEDWQINNEALESRSRLLSAYTNASGVKFWIITEYDRSVTTFLLPEEY